MERGRENRQGHRWVSWGACELPDDTCAPQPSLLSTCSCTGVSTCCRCLQVVLGTNTLSQHAQKAALWVQALVSSLSLKQLLPEGASSLPGFCLQPFTRLPRCRAPRAGCSCSLPVGSLPPQLRDPAEAGCPIHYSALPWRGALRLLSPLDMQGWNGYPCICVLSSHWGYSQK